MLLFRVGGGFERSPIKRSRGREDELVLLAALNGLKTFTSQVSNLSVRLMLDNFTAVHYIKKSCGTKSSALSAISADIVT